MLSTFPSADPSGAVASPISELIQDDVVAPKAAFDQPAIASTNLPVASPRERPAETHNGPDVLSILAKASDWAVNERHAQVTIDHLLFALTEQEVGAKALLASGVIGVSELEVDLLNIVHQLPIPALADGEQPIVEDAVLAVLNHALGYARQNGRNTSTASDVICALLDALKTGKPNTPGMIDLRKRWPNATELDGTHQILLQIRESQSIQPATIAKALADELAALRGLISGLEKNASLEPPADALPWYRRLSVLLLSGVVVASTGAGLSIITG